MWLVLGYKIKNNYPNYQTKCIFSVLLAIENHLLRTISNKYVSFITMFEWFDFAK